MWNVQEKTLFLSREGGALNHVWLSTQIAQYVKRAEIGKHGGCHLFQHTMATLMLEGGADIRFIQVMLGHAEMSNDADLHAGGDTSASASPCEYASGRVKTRQKQRKRASQYASFTRSRKHGRGFVCGFRRRGR